jgi:homoserine acetyltransferase
MDALTYVRLTQCMDTHDVCRGRAGPDVGAEQDNHNASTADVSENSSAPACASVDGTQQQQQQQQVLSAVRCPVLVLGLDSDALYPLHQVQELSRNLPRAQWRLIRTAHGHDGFLLEQDQVNEAVRTFLDGVV